MIILDILITIAELILLLFVTMTLILTARNNKFQKLWDKEKADILRIEPAITRAELCERYVMFCKRNDCKVEF
jgi:hypothetical protein